MKNWKTTLAGILSGMLTAGAGAYQSMSVPGVPMNWGMIAASAGMAAIGFLAKDAGVTGTEK